MDLAPQSIEALFLPATIRERAQKIYARSLTGKTHFNIHEEKLPQTAEFVLDVIKRNYPDLNVPYHSRWRHFEVGNQYQLKAYQQEISAADSVTKAKIGLDLIIPSVLVDAGAGNTWVYRSKNSETIGRSEGLALASLDMFLSGALSGSDAGNSLQTTAEGLQSISLETFCQHFQVSESNPMNGVEGRLNLLHNLSTTLTQKEKFFPNHRPGDLVDYLLTTHPDGITAENVLSAIIESLGDIWPGRLSVGEKNLGDTWTYAPFHNETFELIPFHKLSQWISYSVIETLEMSGISVSGVEKLTGLAEYRNGGLMLDSGLISLRDNQHVDQQWAPSSELIIEWRALTVVLLDKLSLLITEKLNKTPEEFPLAKVLEGGTWAAGRELAKKRSPDMAPPINIKSDGTVF